MDPRELEAARPFADGAVVAERYQIGRPLGLGGMGIVFEVEDRNTPGTLFALKALRADLKGEEAMLARKQFECEVTALSAVHSQFVVQKVNASLEGKTPFIVLERLTGCDLATHLTQVGCLSKELTVPLLRMLAAGLRAAHGAGWAHRDLKPANIFIVDREDGLKDLKLLDFSIAKELKDRHTTLAKGTPSYMAPEQYGGHIDERVDVYALGRVAEDMLLGFRSSTSSLATGRTSIDLGPGFQAWLAKAKHVDPDRRFPTPDEAVDELAAALGVARPSFSLPPAIYPSVPSTKPRSSRSWVRGGVAAGLAVAASVTWWGLRFSGDPQDLAEIAGRGPVSTRTVSDAKPPPAQPRGAAGAPAQLPVAAAAPVPVATPAVAEAEAAAPGSKAPKLMAPAARPRAMSPASATSVVSAPQPVVKGEGLAIPSKRPPSYTY